MANVETQRKSNEHKCELTREMERLVGKYYNDTLNVYNKMKEISDINTELAILRSELIELHEHQLKTFESIFDEVTGWKINITEKDR